MILLSSTFIGRATDGWVFYGLVYIFNYLGFTLRDSNTQTDIRFVSCCLKKADMTEHMLISARRIRKMYMLA